MWEDGSGAWDGLHLPCHSALVLCCNRGLLHPVPLRGCDFTQALGVGQLLFSSLIHFLQDQCSLTACLPPRLVLRTPLHSGMATSVRDVGSVQAFLTHGVKQPLRACPVQVSPCSCAPLHRAHTVYLQFKILIGL